MTIDRRAPDQDTIERLTRLETILERMAEDFHQLVQQGSEVAVLRTKTDNHDREIAELSKAIRALTVAVTSLEKDRNKFINMILGVTSTISIGWILWSDNIKEWFVK